MFRNYWYAIELSSNVKKKPVGIRRFDEALALWRTSDGKLVCFRDRCPHRGVRLSRGRLLPDGCLECPFHGLRFDAAGACTRIPAAGKERVPPSSLRVPTYTVREQHGIIWLWWGDAREALPKIPWFDELSEADLPYVELSRISPVGFGRFMEANLDFAHFEFVHRGLTPKGLGPRAEDVKTEVIGDLIRTSGVLRPDDGRTREQAPGVGFFGAVRFPGIATYEVPPTSQRFGFVAGCPVDETSTWMIVRTCLPKGPLLWIRKWLADIVMQRIMFERVIHKQDLDNAEGQFPALCGVDHDTLASPMDAPIIRYHKMWKRALEADRQATLEGPAHSQQPAANDLELGSDAKLDADLDGGETVVSTARSSRAAG